MTRVRVAAERSISTAAEKINNGAVAFSADRSIN